MAGFNRKIKRHLSVAESVEKLPGCKLAIRSNFEIAGPNASQMHSGVRVLVRKVKPRRSRFKERTFPTIQFIGRKLERTPGWAG